MSRIAVLSNTHAGANGVEYAAALRALGHDVLLIGPRFTREDAQRWYDGLREMEWRPTTDEAEVYVDKVLNESPTPDIETEKGELIAPPECDAVITFEAYGDSPHTVVRSGVPHAIVFGDTHTRPIEYFQNVLHERAHDHVFVQFRRSDLASFDHPSKHWLPAAANPAIWRPYPEVEKDLDVLFVGSTHPHVHRDRVALIRYLQDNGIDVTVKHAFGSDAARLMARAKVVLNKSLAGDLNMRVPESLMARAHLLTDTVDGLEQFRGYSYYTYPERCLWSVKEMLAFWDQDEQYVIPEAHKETLARHTYEHRARQLLQTMGLPEEGDGPKFSHDTRTDPRMVGSGDSVIHASGDISSGGIVESTVGTRETDAERWRPVQSVAVVTGREDRRSDERAGSLRGNAGEEKLGEEGDAVKSGEPNVVRLGLVSHGTAWLGSARFGEGSSSKEERNGPVVSVVIPCFNHFDDCTAPLLTLLDKQRLQAEIILVDDGSTDTTTNAEGTGDAFRIIHKSNGGFCSAVNAGVKEARGEFVCVLNNDTMPQEGWLAPLLDELRNGAGIVGSQILNPDGTIQARGLRQAVDGTWSGWDGPMWRSGFRDTGSGFAYDVESIQGACFAMRRDTFLRLGGLDEVWGNGGCCEVDMSLRVAKEGLPVRLRLDSKVRHAEGSTRFYVAGIQEKIAENQRRLIERWGMPDVRNGNTDSGRSSVSVSGGVDWTRDRGPDVRSGRSGEGTLAPHGRPLTLVWEGPTLVTTGGSIGLINKAVTDALRAQGHTVWHAVSVDDDAPDAHITHLWPGISAHPLPNTDAPHWIVIQPYELAQLPPEWAKTWANPRFRLLITPSAYSESLFLAAFPELAGKTLVIPNGVNLDLFNPEGEKAPGRPDLWRCLFVGGMIWRKGIGHLYDAWRLAFPPEEGAPAVLIIKSQGRTTFYQGQTIEPPADLIRPQNVYPTISVIDRDMEATELAEIYRKVDCLVHPFRYEGFCLPLLEAMASGKPVVYSGHAPATEFIVDGAGLAIPSVNHEIDVTSLARGLRWLYEHREDGVAMGAEGRKAAQAYSWPSVAEQYATAIRRICG